MRCELSRGFWHHTLVGGIWLTAGQQHLGSIWIHCRPCHAKSHNQRAHVVANFDACVQGPDV